MGSCMLTQKLWEDPGETGDNQPLNSDESSLSLEEGPASPSTEVGSLSSVVLTFLPTVHVSLHLCLGGQTVLVSPEADAMQDTADSSHNPGPALRFASRPVARHKSLQVPKFEVQCETHELAVLQKNYQNFLIYTDKKQRTCVRMDNKGMG